MRNQTLKNKQSSSIKNTTTSFHTGNTQSILEFVGQDTPLAFTTSQSNDILEPEKQQCINEKPLFQHCMMSIPQFRSKALKSRQLKDRKKDELSRQLYQESKTQPTVKKLKSLSEQNHQKMNKKDLLEKISFQQFIKDQKSAGRRGTCQGLEHIQKRNEKNLLLNIQKLRSFEKNYVQNENQEILNKLTEAGDKSMLYNFIRKGKMKQFITLDCIHQEQEEQKKTLKENVKNKISKRHIYHTLKHKSDVLHKVKAKSFHKQMEYETNFEAKSINTNLKKTFGFNFGGTQKNFKVLQYKQLRIKNQLQSNDQPLRINSKQAHIQNSPPLKEDNSRNKKRGETDLKQKIKINTLGTTNTHFFNKQCQEKNSSSFENSFFDINMIRRKKNVENRQCPDKDIRQNIFRQLTPWHGGDVDLHDFSLV